MQGQYYIWEEEDFKSTLSYTAEKPYTNNSYIRMLSNLLPIFAVIITSLIAADITVECTSL